MNVIELAKSRNQQEGYNKQCISYYYKYCIKLHIYHNQHRLYLIPTKLPSLFDFYTSVETLVENSKLIFFAIPNLNTCEV